MIITTVVKCTRQSFSHSSEFNSNAAAATTRAYTYIHGIHILYTYTGPRMTVACRSDERCVGVWVGDGWRGEGRKSKCNEKTLHKKGHWITTTEAASSGIDPQPPLVAASISSSSYYHNIIMIAIEHAMMISYMIRRMC